MNNLVELGLIVPLLSTLEKYAPGCFRSGQGRRVMRVARLGGLRGRPDKRGVTGEVLSFHRAAGVSAHYIQGGWRLVAGMSIWGWKVWAGATSGKVLGWRDPTRALAGVRRGEAWFFRFTRKSVYHLCFCYTWFVLQTILL